MAGYPTDLRYTEKHEWVRPGEIYVTLGVTELAAEPLGEVSFVQLPYVGELFRTGDPLCSLSSPAAEATVHIPLIGQITKVNQKLDDSPGLVSSDPYGEGWLVEFQPGEPDEVGELMDAEQYEAFVAQGAE